jgi:hypothetical protein
MAVNFRERARQAVRRAKAELASGGEDRVRYAALELRLAMEALTYDRASAYKNEIPPKDYETWQPRKVLELLLDIDPNADKGVSLSVGAEEEYGKAPAEFSLLGTDTALDLATLKKHYDALGSYLHMPTLKQMNEDRHPDTGRLRTRCEKIVEGLEKVLASPIFNVKFGNVSEIECVRCKEKVRKRIPYGTSQVEVECFGCNAPYRMHRKGSESVQWEPLREEVSCPVSGCGARVYVWRDQIKPGSWWTCDRCGDQIEIVLGLAKKSVHEPGTSGGG